MLNGTLELHGVDAERLATEVANKWCREQRRHNSHPTQDRKEDLIAYLIGICWEISLRYTPAKHPNFEVYARSILSLRCTDWIRKDQGRTQWKFAGHTYTRERPQLLSLEHPDDTGNPLERTLPDPSSHDPTDSDPALTRLETQRDRHRDRDHHLLRTAATRRAA